MKIKFAEIILNRKRYFTKLGVYEHESVSPLLVRSLVNSDIHSILEIMVAFVICEAHPNESNTYVRSAQTESLSELTYVP